MRNQRRLRNASSQMGEGGLIIHPKGMNAKAGGAPCGSRRARRVWRCKRRGAKVVSVSTQQNEMPKTPISGCSANATAASCIACQRFPSRIRETAKRISAVARLRGCRYWSMT